MVDIGLIGAEHLLHRAQHPRGAHQRAERRRTGRAVLLMDPKDGFDAAGMLAEDLIGVEVR
jgi:hypothetical protein